MAFSKANLMPDFPLPEGETELSWFRKEVWAGMDRRFPGGYDDARRERAEYEMSIIEQMGFCGYFLVVADFIMWAKRNGIRVGPGRGSAAGSIVSYAMGITDLDPIAFGLMFERFLNPERVSMPDIDIDFDERRRGDVIRYVTEKYGDDRVAQIITYGTIKAKAAVKDSARVLGFPYALGDRITKAFPPAGDGQGHPAVRDLRRRPSALRRGGRDPGAVRGRARGQAGAGDGARAGRPDPAGGRARGRRDHEQGAAARSRADLEAAGRRRDHHPVRLPELRGPRAAQDGLPRPAQPDDPGRRAGRDQVEPGRHDRPGNAAAGRQADLRPAGQRRHARGVPARGRPDAGAAAVDAAGPVRGHLRGQRAVPARPDGRQRAQRLRRPQDGAQAGRADPPGAGRAAGRNPGRHLRPDRLSGAGAAHRAEAGRLLGGQGRPAAQGHGQEEEGDPGRRVRAVRGRDAVQRVLRRGNQGYLGHSRPVLRLRLQPGAHRQLRHWSGTGRPTSRRTSPPSTWPRC